MRCINCKKELKNKKSLRCYSCNNKFRWKNLDYKKRVGHKISIGNLGIKKPLRSKNILKENNPNWKGGTSLKLSFCFDCNSSIRTNSKRCRSCASKYNWTQKKYRSKLRFNKQNLIEKKLEMLLNKLFFKEYKYVGDGKFFIGRFNPDFVHKQEKKIIELYGDYWHNLPSYKERDKRRLKTYKKYRYLTLIIWEKELNNINKLTKKLKKW